MLVASVGLWASGSHDASEIAAICSNMRNWRSSSQGKQYSYGYLTSRWLLSQLSSPSQPEHLLFIVGYLKSYKLALFIHPTHSYRPITVDCTQLHPFQHQ